MTIFDVNDKLIVTDRLELMGCLPDSEVTAAITKANCHPSYLAHHHHKMVQRRNCKPCHKKCKKCSCDDGKKVKKVCFLFS